jgi:hypothetical protein
MKQEIEAKLAFIRALEIDDLKNAGRLLVEIVELENGKQVVVSFIRKYLYGTPDWLRVIPEGAHTLRDWEQYVLKENLVWDDVEG